MKKSKKTAKIVSFLAAAKGKVGQLPRDRLTPEERKAFNLISKDPKHADAAKVLEKGIIHLHKVYMAVLEKITDAAQLAWDAGQMKSCGVILTYMSRQDWKGQKFWIKLRTMFFNLCLFLWQLTFLIVGTAYGKIKSITSMRQIWRAAQCSHVRLVLWNSECYWVCINFGYPTAELQMWYNRWNDGKRFEYRDPTFSPSPEFVAAMIEYAERQVGKGYDDLQLISNGLHLIAWIIWPWSWGKELKVIKAFNRPGGREHRISGVTACLRWPERDFNKEYSAAAVAAFNRTKPPKVETRFFPGYSTATTSPCLAVIDENWRAT